MPFALLFPGLAAGITTSERCLAQGLFAFLPHVFCSCLSGPHLWPLARRGWVLRLFIPPAALRGVSWLSWGSQESFCSWPAHTACS